LSWSKLAPRRGIRLWVLLLLGIVGVALMTEPWWTLIGICAAYLLLLPYGMLTYTRFKRRRAVRPTPEA
jgi:CDP-diacylglycerol--serine O-phosphatidyltransferase